MAYVESVDDTGIHPKSATGRGEDDAMGSAIIALEKG